MRLMFIVSGNTISRKIINLPIENYKIHVTYSAKPSKDAICTKKLPVLPHTSLFDIMKKAQEGNDAFRFTYKMYGPQAFITSIGGVVQDPNKHLYWFLYNCTQNLGAAQCDDMKSCTLSDTGLSKTYPKDGGIWLFCYEKNPYRNKIIVNIDNK
ncbi:unnamed protein product [Meganyctiphanes norvegica]|uniref:Transcobalamin-like C-terminal domain-containing protein n=1 Tax=Meganyctiphanes norvegica TaxID=48144 RepID=A0AAV2PRV8_MEGNR